MKLKGEKMLMRYEYDFAKDGGAVGIIELRPASNNTLANAKILNAYVVEEEEITSAGTPTITFGYDGDEDSYMADAYAALAAEGVDSGLALDRASVLNETPVLEIGTAALTAGKIALYVEVLL